MKKFVARAFAMLLCVAMLCTSTAFAAPAEAHDHDLQRAVTPVRTGLLHLVADGIAVQARAVTPVRSLLREAVPEETTPAPETPVGCEHVWGEKWTETTNDCQHDYVEISYEKCTKCGYVQSTARRPYGNVKGDHHYVAEQIQDPTCSRRTYTRYTCSVCHDSYEVGARGHDWGPWIGDDSTNCTNPVTRTCNLCGATENRNANRVHTWGEIQRRGSCATGWTLYHVCTRCKTEEVVSTTTGHIWENFNEPSSCTQTGRSGQRCSVCGAEQGVVTIPITHFPNADDGDCRTAVTCSKCGAITTPAKASHNFGNSWKHDGESHWQVCQNPGCKATSSAQAHKMLASKDCTQPGYCSVCGYKSGTALYTSHDFTGDYVIAHNTYHTRKCSHPGCQIVSAAEPHQMPEGDFPCTETVRCVCGYPMRQGVNAHDYGEWTANGNGHSRTCKKCGYVQTGTHTGSSSGSCTTAVSCTVCGQVLVHAFGSHSYGVWIPSANGTGHYRTCTRAGCTAIEVTNHSGGKATCKSAAICSVCGGSYGSRSTSNHVGGTEVRGYKAPGIGVAGYTGDTYCLGCGAVLQRGVSIAMLAPDHTHEYGSWVSDSLHHWKQCACSERSEYEAHSFVNGTCSVCGAKDPNYKVCSGSLHVGGIEIRNAKPAGVGVDGYTGDKYCTACQKKIASGTVITALAEDHVHNFSSGWKSDSANHWHECNCGQQSALAAHIFGANGRCVYCGELDPAVESQQEAHIHTYGPLVSNGQDHWRECTICGEQADRAHHMILDGVCMDCGYKKVDTASFKDLQESDWYYDSVRRVMETGLITGVEGENFQPEATVARGQVADILYRMAGSPISDGSSAYADVAGEAYVNAISWAAGNSIMEGEDQTFDPAGNATVEDVVIGLWRYAALLGTDGADTAQNAMEWAVQTGLLAGYEQQPDPADEATRTDVAVLVSNFMQSMKILSEDSPTDLA